MSISPVRSIYSVVSPIFVDNNNDHTHIGKKREKERVGKKRRRTINGRHQPSKAIVNWRKMMIIVISSSGTLLHQCSYIFVDEANSLLSSLTCNIVFSYMYVEKKE
jgi:hypothetical protein